MAKRGLYANIHAKKKRIAAGSGEKMRKPGAKGAPTAANFKRAAKTAKKNLKRKSNGRKPIRKTTGKGGNYRKTKSGAGMTKKGVAAYRRANPGSKLKTAVTGKVKPGSKAANRRKSYCARSAGQLKRSSAKTRNDPNSRIRQARRRWKC